jgi:hypothetical protein
MKTDNQHPKTATYLFLLAIQRFGAITFVWRGITRIQAGSGQSGEQLPKDAYSDLVIVGVLSVMQISFWYRLLRIPIPFRRSNLFLNHLLLFLGRASASFLAARYSPSSFSGTFQNWAGKPTCF